MEVLDTDLLLDAARRAVVYRSAPHDAPVFPTQASLDALDEVTSVLPDGSRSPSDTIIELDTLGSPATVRSTNGRYFGFVTGGSDPVAVAASFLVATWDQNAGPPGGSPVAAHLDAIAARWVCELLGLPSGATAAFCSGASVANLTCLIAARDALLRNDGWNVATQGLVGSPPIDVVASEEIHATIPKTLRAMGVGSDAISYVPTDSSGRIDATQLPEMGPRTLVLCQAGNVNTGHADPFPAITEAAHEKDAWVHIDGAFGLWAAASPRHAHLVAGSENADSWATDAHKWLNVPYDAGLAICARGSDLTEAMGIDAAYVPETSELSPMHRNLQMSQRARGVETWAAIATRGRQGVADLIATCCDLAATMADLLEDGGAEILAPVVLNQILVSFGEDATTNAVIAAVQNDRVCWAGGTTWNGHRAMRVSVSDRATTEDDIRVSAAAILAARDHVTQRSGSSV